MNKAIGSALRWATERIGTLSESPRLDAELLLAYCLDQPRSYLYSWPEKTLDSDCWERFQALVERRLEPMPIAYLLGHREFYALDFETKPTALVPRPETELLIEQALELIPADAAWNILDLGTGTGNIAITLKTMRPNARIIATDVDPNCVDLAKRNAARLGVEIDIIVSNWFEQVPGASRFDLIVSNPPYIAANHPFLRQGDLPAEPGLALTPGNTGLEALEIIIRDAPNFLSPGGYMIVEHGYDQQAGVAALFREHGFTDIFCAVDLNDLPRTTRAKLVEKGDNPA